MIEVKPDDQIRHYEDRTFPIVMAGFIVVLLLGAGTFYWLYGRQLARLPTGDADRSFEAVYTQLGIQRIPARFERRTDFSAWLDQLQREPCYRDAMLHFARGLLDAGFPREAAVGLQNFAKRCGSEREILPLAYDALERISDFTGALDVATKLVSTAPENGTVRYWRAIAYDQMGDFAHALIDYMNTIQLMGSLRNVNGDVFFKLSQAYEKLGRPCDAIAPIEMYVSLDPAKRRTPQTDKIISDYAAKGNCASNYANGTARVAFAAGSDVHMISALVNGVVGSFILDTGASFVSMTSQFASKAKIVPEAENQVTIQTAGGKILAAVGYASSVSVGKASAANVVVVVERNAENPFGPRVDGLLGMSFLSRFNVNLRRDGVELTAVELK